MSYIPIAKTVPQYENSSGVPYVGAVLKAYANGTSTNISMATDSTGGTLVADIVLNSEGYPEVSGNVIIPHIDQDYKLALYPTQADADADTNAIWNPDNIAFTAQQWVKGADVASATSLLINITGNEFDITGTTTITSFASKGIGTVVILHFDGSLTLTHHSTDLVLPDSKDIVTTAGDIGIFYEYALGDWRLVSWNTVDTQNNSSSINNLSFTASVATNALTVNLKTLAATDPSSTDIVQIAFRDATLTTGNYVVRDITAALSAILDAGATLGFTNSETGFIYLYAIDNAGTVELAFARQAIFDESTTHNTTILSASSDSDIVLYSEAARTGVAIRLIGKILIQTGATAGNWSNAATALTVWSPAMKKTGDIIQTVNTQTGAVATGTTLLPKDDTIPQNTEGDEYMTLAITPKDTISTLKIEITIQLANSANDIFCAALFQDSTADALAAQTGSSNGSNVPVCIPFTHTMAAGTTSSTTFKVRAGAFQAGTTTFNGVSGGRQYGGVLASSIVITEILP